MLGMELYYCLFIRLSHFWKQSLIKSIKNNQRIKYICFEYLQFLQGSSELRKQTSVFIILLLWAFKNNYGKYLKGLNSFLLHHYLKSLLFSRANRSIIQQAFNLNYRLF